MSRPKHAVGVADRHTAAGHENGHPLRRRDDAGDEGDDERRRDAGALGTSDVKSTLMPPPSRCTNDRRDAGDSGARHREIHI